MFLNDHMKTISNINWQNLEKRKFPSRCRGAYWNLNNSKGVCTSNLKINLQIIETHEREKDMKQNLFEYAFIDHHGRIFQSFLLGLFRYESYLAHQ